MKAAAGRNGGPNFWYSIGLRIGGGRGPAAAGAGGTIADVRYGSPADAAKLYPGQQIIAVNGKTFTADALAAAIRDAAGKTEPIHIVLQHEGAVLNVDLNYHDGEKYPTLQRVDGTPDYLSDIATPLTKTEHAPGYKPGGHQGQQPQE
jgi:predicted metalloprotease with PDZ domain